MEGPLRKIFFTYEGDDQVHFWNDRATKCQRGEEERRKEPEHLMVQLAHLHA